MTGETWVPSIPCRASGTENSVNNDMESLAEPMLPVFRSFSLTSFRAACPSPGSAPPALMECLSLTKAA